MEITTYYDLETNGFLYMEEKSGIKVVPLSLGYVQVYPDFTVKSLGTLYYYYPGGVNIPKSASEVNGLTNDFLYKYKDQFFDNVIKAYILLHRNNIVGKNNHAFDDKVIPRLFKECMLEAPQWLKSMDIQPDYSKEYRQVTGETRRKGTLEELSKLFLENDETNEFLTKHGKETGVAHTALWDAATTMLLHKRFLNKQGITEIEDSQKKLKINSIKYLNSNVQEMTYDDFQL